MSDTSSTTVVHTWALVRHCTYVGTCLGLPVHNQAIAYGRAGGGGAHLGPWPATATPTHPHQKTFPQGKRELY